MTSASLSRPPARKCVAALLSACLLLSLTGCAHDPVTVTQTVYVLPPETLVQDCQEPDPSIEDFGDVLELVPLLREAIRTCNTDKAALRKWRHEHQEPTQ